MRRTCKALTLAALLATAPGLLAPLAHADNDRRQTNIPAQELESALQAFAKERSMQIIFRSKLVKNLKSRALSGPLTPNEALDQLLGGTGLSYRYLDDKTVTIYPVGEASPNLRAIRDFGGDAASLNQYLANNGFTLIRVNPGAAESRPQPLQLAQADTASAKSQEATEVEVVSSRIEGLNNKGLLQGGENGALYHDVITREDIQRSGVTSLEELFRTIPQTSSPRTGIQSPEGNVNISGGQTYRFNTMGLRGFEAGQTIILVNGRAMPRTGATGGADLSRIPLNAIERIEIMPYAGSAIYGGGAIGGAINIIMRKEYSGRDLTAYVGTTSEGGATERRLDYLQGFSFAGGRGRTTITAGYSSRDPLRAQDRDYLSEAIRRYPQTNNSIVDGSGKTPYESFILPAFAGRRATLVVGNLPNAAVNTLGIPGAPGARWASIPAGTTNAGSLTLTPASFTATAGQADLGMRYGRSVLYEPMDASTANAQVEYDVIGDGWLSVYGEFSLGYNRKDYSYPQYFLVQLSATDPLNPFRQDVTPGFAGRPVNVYLDPFEVDDPSTLAESESARAVVGVKGKFNDRIEWSLDGAYDYAHSSVNSDNPGTSLLQLLALTITGNPGPAASAATRRAIYPLLADHTQFPISDATADSYFQNNRYSFFNSDQLEGNARITADVVTLPAGPLRASVFGKYQAWDSDSGQYFFGSAATSQLVNNGPQPLNASGSISGRDIWQTAAEMSIPVIGKGFRPIPVESLEIQASTSKESHQLSSATARTRQESDANVFAAKLQITPDIALRGSYSEGFFPASLGSLTQAVQSLPLTFPVTDPLRGNTTALVTFTYTFGGNPDLEPEQAESKNFGIILTPRFLPGFSLNLDYWKIAKLNAINSANIIQVLGNPVLYSGSITRAAPTAQDLANGWAGVITAADVRPTNVSSTSTEGLDMRLRYSMDTTAMGSFQFNANATYTRNFILQVTPTATPLDTSNGSGPLRRRGNASVTWSEGAWSATVSSRYIGGYSASTTAPSPSYPAAIPYDGARIPAYVHWDLQTVYEMPMAGNARGLREFFSATKWTLGINNVLNDEPSFVTNGTSFYNQYDDPRQRYMYLSVQKAF